MNCLLVGPQQEGGEGVYIREVLAHPPDGVSYSVSQQFHRGADHARCHAVQEILLNRLVHPFLRYGFGFRVLSVDRDIDLVHVHSHPTKIQAKHRVPVVMSAGSSHYIYVRDYERWSDGKIRRRYALARMMYRPLGIHDELLNPDGVARIYTFSSWAREIYGQHGVPLHKVDVIYPGFAVPSVPDRPADRESVRFVFVGREFTRKGGPLVIKAFERVREKHKHVSLRIVTRDFEHIEPMTGLEVLPFMDREQLYHRIYPEADVFVMPTEAEGWGFTNAEAMSFGLPVISTGINAIPEIVEDGVTGMLIEPGDGEALACAMNRLAESRGRREEMGGRGRERFLARFTRERFRSRLGEFYAAALRS